jgi:hypothetical protein
MYRRKTACIVHAALRVYPPSPAAAQGPRTAAGILPAFQKKIFGCESRQKSH